LGDFRRPTLDLRTDAWNPAWFPTVLLSTNAGQIEDRLTSNEIGSWCYKSGSKLNVHLCKWCGHGRNSI